MMAGGYLQAGADCRVGISWVDNKVRGVEGVSMEGGIILSTKLTTRAGRAYLKVSERSERALRKKRAIKCAKWFQTAGLTAGLVRLFFKYF